MKLRLAASALALVASGCATVPGPGAPGDWPARRDALQVLDRWSLHGRIAVAAGEDGFSGGFDWSQQGATADIDLSGPMGGTAMNIRIEGDRPVVTVDGSSHSGDDARQFIDERFGRGRSLPIRQALLARRRTRTARRSEETLGEDSRLAGLSQSGWQVRYDRYQQVGAIALPARMEMTTEGLRLRVAISEWRLSP